MEIGLSALIILIFIAFGMSVSSSFLAGGLIYVLWSGSSLNAIASTAFFELEKTTILAIPLFMLAGSLMGATGIADRLIDLAAALLRKRKGGMGATIPLGSMMFGAVNGSGTATISALSKIMLPRMGKMGWDKRYTATMLACSASLGFMIPPNMNAILFSSVTNASIAALFMSTLIPGILWGTLLIIVNNFVYKKWLKPETMTPDFAMLLEEESKESYVRSVWKATVKAIPAIVMILIIFIGIYGGFFSPTEAGAVSCVYAILVGILNKSINKDNFIDVFKSTGLSMGTFMIIMPMVAIFSRFLILNQVPQMIASGISQITTNPILVILLIDLVLIIAGMFLDAGVLILVITPMLVPTAMSIGMSMTQLAVIMFVCVGIGTVTPPMAMNLFIGGKAANVEVMDMMEPLKPLLLYGSIPILLLVSFIPELSLWLPRLLGFSV